MQTKKNVVHVQIKLRHDWSNDKVAALLEYWHPVPVPRHENTVYQSGEMLKKPQIILLMMCHSSATHYAQKVWWFLHVYKADQS